MSNQKHVKDLFNKVCNEITNSLHSKLKEKLDETQMKYVKQSKAAKVQAEIDSVKEEIELLQKKQKDLIEQKSKLDPVIEVTNEDDKTFYKSFPNMPNEGSYYSFKIKESRKKTADKLKDSIEYQNLLTWRQVKQQYEYAMGLASGIKEMRTMLMQLQSYDWHSLGIDIPASFTQFNKVDISNGKITIQALPGKKN